MRVVLNVFLLLSSDPNEFRILSDYHGLRKLGVFLGSETFKELNINK